MQKKLIHFPDIIGFEWDDGNLNKNKAKHDLDFWFIEEIFFNNPFIITFDVKHSQNENRWFALGKTDNGTKLMIVFTIRKNKI